MAAGFTTLPTSPSGDKDAPDKVLDTNNKEVTFVGYVTPSCGGSIPDGTWTRESTNPYKSVYVENKQSYTLKLTIKSKDDWHDNCPEITRWTWRDSKGLGCTKTVTVLSRAYPWTLNLIKPSSDTSVQRGGVIELQANVDPAVGGCPVKFYAIKEGESKFQIGTETETNNSGEAKSYWSTDENTEITKYKIWAVLGEGDNNYCQKPSTLGKDVNEIPGEDDPTIEVEIIPQDSWNIVSSPDSASVCWSDGTYTATWTITVTNNDVAVQDQMVQVYRDSSWVDISGNTNADGIVYYTENITTTPSNTVRKFRIFEHSTIESEWTSVELYYYKLVRVDDSSLTWENNGSSKPVKWVIKKVTKTITGIIETPVTGNSNNYATSFVKSTVPDGFTIDDDDIHYTPSTGEYSVIITRSSSHISSVNNESFGITFVGNNICVDPDSLDWTINANEINSYNISVYSTQSCTSLTSVTPSWTIHVTNHGENVNISSLTNFKVYVNGTGNSSPWGNAVTLSNGSDNSRKIYNMTDYNVPCYIKRYFNIVFDELDEAKIIGPEVFERSTYKIEGYVEGTNDTIAAWDDNNNNVTKKLYFKCVEYRKDASGTIVTSNIRVDWTKDKTSDSLGTGWTVSGITEVLGQSGLYAVEITRDTDSVSALNETITITYNQALSSVNSCLQNSLVTFTLTADAVNDYVLTVEGSEGCVSGSTTTITPVYTLSVSNNGTKLTNNDGVTFKVGESLIETTWVSRGYWKYTASTEVGVPCIETITVKALVNDEVVDTKTATFERYKLFMAPAHIDQVTGKVTPGGGFASSVMLTNTPNPDGYFGEFGTFALFKTFIAGNMTINDEFVATSHTDWIVEKDEDTDHYNVIILDNNDVAGTCIAKVDRTSTDYFNETVSITYKHGCAHNTFSVKAKSYECGGIEEVV